MEIQKRCKYCGRSFIAHKITTIYCSPSCNNKDYKRAFRQKQIADYCEAHSEDKEDTREAKTPKLVIKHLNYYNEAAIEQLFNRDPEKFEVPKVFYIYFQNLGNLH